MGSLSRFINWMKAKESQSIKVRITHQVDMPAIATAPTIGPTFGHPIFPPEADTAIASFAGDQLNFYAINKQFITCR